MLRKVLWIIIIATSMLVLWGCEMIQPIMPATAPKTMSYPITETWMSMTDVNPDAWTHARDQWFLTGEPNATEAQNLDEGMRSTAIKVASFSRVKVRGDFQTQIVSDGDPAVYLLGPHSATQFIAIHVVNDTLYVTQTHPMRSQRMSRVIVRITLTALRQLVQGGGGSIEVAHVTNAPLDVISKGAGSIYLAGDINIKHVTLCDHGSIFILGANTTFLDVKSMGFGAVNIAGHIGLHSIIHHGCGAINIMGATNTGPVNIEADGIGKIIIIGHLGIVSVCARDYTCVYICAVNAPHINAITYGRATVGISGFTRHLTVRTHQDSQFLGSHLCVLTAEVMAYDASHINVTASESVFANANQNSTVYFFGPSTLINAFGSHNGGVIPLNVRNACNVASEYRPYSYTFERFGVLHRNYKDE